MIFFFNDTATTEIYTLSLHDALPISDKRQMGEGLRKVPQGFSGGANLFGEEAQVVGVGEHLLQGQTGLLQPPRSEEHTSELQSRQYLVCRLLLEKKNMKTYYK